MRSRSPFYEIPVFYFALLVVQFSFLADPLSFHRLEPHPYWLGVLIFALRYGMPAGIASGATAAALYLSFLWIFGERYRFDDADFYVLPALFAVVGAACGAVIDRRDYELARLKRRIAESAERLRALRSELRVQRKSNRAVEQQVVSQMSSLVTLYHGSRELSSTDRESLLDGILEFFSSALGAQKASIYIKQNDRWVLRSKKGWTKDDAYAESLDYTQGVIGKAGAEGRVVSLRDWFGVGVEKAWEGRTQVDAVMAGPLRREGGEVAAVFAVQDLPLLRFNTASINLMALLMDWGEEALTKSHYFDELRSKSIMDEVYGVYNERYFSARAKQEFVRSTTYSLPLSILLVSPSGLEDLSMDKQVNYLRALSRLLSEKSRDIDIVTKFTDPGIPFAVMMTTATNEMAENLRRDVLAAHDKLQLSSPGRGPSVSLKIGVGSYAAAMTSLEELVGQAKKKIS